MSQSWSRPLSRVLILIALVTAAFYGWGYYRQAGCCTPAGIFRSKHYDVIVYGATPAGIAAAINAKKQGVSVLLIEPTKHVGGIMTSGLGATDICFSDTIGGFSREFFDRVADHYNRDKMWRFEPHVAEEIFDGLLDENQIPVLRNAVIDSLVHEKHFIRFARLSDGTVFDVKAVIDATYEGDLLPLAGVTYTYGREGKSQYSESLAGISHSSTRDQFPSNVTGKDKDGNQFKFIGEVERGNLGEGDERIPSYNYRVCVTKEASNKVPFPKPDNYDPLDYRLLVQYLHHQPNLLLSQLFRFLHLPNHKYDLNNAGPFSSNLIGGSWDYPEASHEERKKIAKTHADYLKGLLYFVTHEPAIPPHIRAAARELGLCKDEFTDNDNWPYQIYVRVARRLVGEYVLTQSDLNMHSSKEDVVAIASCPVESHHTSRFIEDGHVKNEGWVTLKVAPYHIPYRSLVPRRGEIQNLIVPVALSASHIAYSSLRMEPVFMVLGHSSGVAAALAVKEGVAVQDIPYEKLSLTLKKDLQRLVITSKISKKGHKVLKDPRHFGTNEH